MDAAVRILKARPVRERDGGGVDDDQEGLVHTLRPRAVRGANCLRGLTLCKCACCSATPGTAKAEPTMLHRAGDECKAAAAAAVTAGGDGGGGDGAAAAAAAGQRLRHREEESNLRSAQTWSATVRGKSQSKCGWE